MPSPMPEVEPVTTADFPLSMLNVLRLRVGLRLERWRPQYVAPQYNSTAADCEPYHDTAGFAAAVLIKARPAHARPATMASVFPAPDHDHARCSADAMAHAEALCAARGSG